MVFLLNVVAFVLIGMQLRPIWAGLGEAVRWQYCLVAAAVLVTVIVVRIVWVMSYGGVMRLAITHYDPKAIGPMSRPSLRGALLISWCGMRGIVTLAAAFALPEQFPYRDLILLTAFGVVLGTLVLQGLTLRPLVTRLALDDGNPVMREVILARGAAYRAAIEAIDGDPSNEARILRVEYDQMLIRTQVDDERSDSGQLPADPLRRRAIAAARQTIFAMRQSGEIGDDAFHHLEEEFDWAELSAAG